MHEVLDMADNKKCYFCFFKESEPPWHQPLSSLWHAGETFGLIELFSENSFLNLKKRLEDGSFKKALN